MVTKIVFFGEMSSGLLKQKCNCLFIMTLCLEEKRGCLQAEEHHPNHEACGWQHHVVGVLVVGGTGAFHKIDGIMREGNYVDILKQHLKTSVRKLKHGCK